MKRKRFLPWILTFFLLIGIFSGGITAYAVSGTGTSGGYSYAYDTVSMTCTITWYSGSDTDITIPSELDGYTVTAIGDGIGQISSSVTSVTVPGSVTSISAKAFSWITSLRSVTLLYGVTSIGVSAFYYSALTSITIPGSVTSIGASAFAGCNLTNITIPRSVTSIGNSAFFNSDLENVTISSGTIGAYAFENSNLTNITLLYGVTSIGASAFAGCNLTNITIPRSVTSIGDSAFFNSNLENVTISSGTIGAHAFERCSSLTSAMLLYGVTSIGVSAFYNSALTSITIPGSVTSIDDNAFYLCSSLASVTIPERVTSIGNEAFSICSGLSSIYFDGSIFSTTYDNFIDSWRCPTLHWAGESATNSITVSDAILHGSITPSTISGMAGETISLQITPDDGYAFAADSLIYTDGTTAVPISDASFTMPGCAVTISADFELVETPSFTFATASDTNDTTPTWYWETGNASDNSGYYRYKFDGADTWTYTAATSYTPSSTLSDGSYTLIIEEMNNAGNWSFAESHTIHVDTAAPDAPTITTESQATSGASITITGTAEAGSTVTISGGSSAAAGTADGSGNFSITVPLRSNTVNTLSAAATDVAGNESTASSEITVKADSTAPSAPAIATESQSTSGLSITITGTAEAGSTVAVSGGSSTATGTADDSGNFSITVPLTPNSINTLSARPCIIKFAI